MTTDTFPFLASPLWLRARALWQRVARLSRRTPRRLRLRETLPLGEHRFVAVIEFERTRLLIGGTPSSLVLLAHLDSDPAAADTDSDKSGFTQARFAETCSAEGGSAGTRSAGTQLAELEFAERKKEKERTEERKRESF